MFFNLLCDAHPQQSPLFQIWHELPGIYKFGILAAAVVFFWAKVSRNTGEVKTGVGVTTLNAEEQMTNWAGTQQMNGETIVEIAKPTTVLNQLPATMKPARKPHGRLNANREKTNDSFTPGCRCATRHFLKFDKFSHERKISKTAFGRDNQHNVVKQTEMVN